MTNYVVTFTQEPFFIQCSSEEEALDVASDYPDIVNCIIIGEAPLVVRKLEMRVGYSKKTTDVRDYIGEDNYKEMLDNNKIMELELKE